MLLERGWGNLAWKNLHYKGFVALYDFQMHLEIY